MLSHSSAASSCSSSRRPHRDLPGRLEHLGHRHVAAIVVVVAPAAASAPAAAPTSSAAAAAASAATSSSSAAAAFPGPSLAHRGQRVRGAQAPQAARDLRPLGRLDVELRKRKEKEEGDEEEREREEIFQSELFNFFGGQ